MDILNANNISINQSCGGNGSCTTCRIITHSESKNFSERNEVETELAAERGFKNTERLACQTQLLDSVTIEIPEDVD